MPSTRKGSFDNPFANLAAVPSSYPVAGSLFSNKSGTRKVSLRPTSELMREFKAGLVIPQQELSYHLCNKEKYLLNPVNNKVIHDLQEAKQVCDNFEKFMENYKNKEVFVCLGHEQGCSKMPSFHGDSNHYSMAHCSHCISINKGGQKQYLCLGHHLTFHGDPLRDPIEIPKTDLGENEKLLDQPSLFFVYPKEQYPPFLGLWEFNINPDKICNNYEKMPGLSFVYICRGHGNANENFNQKKTFVDRNERPFERLENSYHGDPARNYRFRLIKYNESMPK